MKPTLKMLLLVVTGLVAVPVFAQSSSDPCIAQVYKEREDFKKGMEEGIKSGKIDAAKKAALLKTHSELVAMEKKAAEDKRMSQEECRAIAAKIVEERHQLAAALSDTSKAPPAKKEPPCIAQVKKEREDFKKAMEEGIKSGKIDKQEQAALVKTHKELIDLEKKVAEDKKMTRDECRAIAEKIGAERRQLAAALQSGPVVKK